MMFVTKIMKGINGCTAVNNVFKMGVLKRTIYSSGAWQSSFSNSDSWNLLSIDLQFEEGNGLRVGGDCGHNGWPVILISDGCRCCCDSRTSLCGRGEIVLWMGMCRGCIG